MVLLLPAPSNQINSKSEYRNPKPSFAEASEGTARQFLKDLLASRSLWRRLVSSFVLRISNLRSNWKIFWRGLALIIIATSVLYSGTDVPPKPSVASPPQENQPQTKTQRVFSSLIEIPLVPERLAEVAAPETITAKAALVTDLATGEVLWEKNSQAALPPASTTKIMTALVSLENYSLGEVVIVNSACASLTKDQSQMGLVAGEKITVENLLYGLLVQSATDAACALAQAFPGGEVEFVAAMNAKAKNLGMNQTAFSNPSGNDTNDSIPHFSSAWDLTIVTKEALRSPTFRQIVGTKEINLPSFDQKYWHLVKNTNELLFTFPGTVGVKTGYTEKALGCLVLDYAQRNHEVLVVVLGSEDRFGEARVLAEWTFEAYRW